MKYTKILFIICFLLATSGCWWNSNESIIERGKNEFNEILVPGSSKSKILYFLKSKKYYYSESGNLYDQNGKCMKWYRNKTEWNCEFPSYIFTRVKAGFLTITDPHLKTHFFFDEKDNLVKYNMSVGHTFL